MQFTFKYDETELKTVIGGIYSLLMFSLVLEQALWCEIKILRLEQYSFLVRQQHYRTEEISGFGRYQNMIFAFGIVELDMDYGRLRASYESLSPVEKEHQYTDFQNRFCTDSDFGFGE